jgi:hypothetical protein
MKVPVKIREKRKIPLTRKPGHITLKRRKMEEAVSNWRLFLCGFLEFLRLIYSVQKKHNQAIEYLVSRGGNNG